MISTIRPRAQTLKGVFVLARLLGYVRSVGNKPGGEITGSFWSVALAACGMRSCGPEADGLRLVVKIIRRTLEKTSIVKASGWEIS